MHVGKELLIGSALQDQRRREAPDQSPEGDHFLSVSHVTHTAQMSGWVCSLCASIKRRYSTKSCYKHKSLSLPSSQLHVMDETHVINQVKEDVCYVSQQFYKDMEIAQ